MILLADLPTAVDVLFAANRLSWIAPLNLALIPSLPDRRASAQVGCTIPRLLAVWQAFPAACALSPRCACSGVRSISFGLPPNSPAPRSPAFPISLRAGDPALLSARGFTIACILIALIALLFRDQRQVTEERAPRRRNGSACEIQQYLIPETAAHSRVSDSERLSAFARSGRRFLPGASRPARRKHVDRGRRRGGKRVAGRHARGAHRRRHPHRVPIQTRSRPHSGPS